MTNFYMKVIKHLLYLIVGYAIFMILHWLCGYTPVLTMNPTALLNEYPMFPVPPTAPYLNAIVGLLWLTMFVCWYTSGAFMTIAITTLYGIHKASKE